MLGLNFNILNVVVEIKYGIFFYNEYENCNIYKVV